LYILQKRAQFYIRTDTHLHTDTHLYTQRTHYKTWQKLSLTRVHARTLSLSGDRDMTGRPTGK